MIIHGILINDLYLKNNKIVKLLKDINSFQSEIINKITSLYYYNKLFNKTKYYSIVVFLNYYYIINKYITNNCHINSLYYSIK